MAPLSPYQLIYDLLVEHLQAMTHQGRIAWLEQGNLRYLVASLALGEPTTIFVPDLLTAAYHHGGAGDVSLRRLLVHLSAAYKVHPDLAHMVLRRAEDRGTDKG